jgi:hypothetical protein
MNASSSTESEEVFERYLHGQGLRWGRVETTTAKHPDYVVLHNDTKCFFEVKEFDDPLKKPVGGLSPCSSIREKISQARKQFKKYRNHCCVLVLWNSKSVYRGVFLDVVGCAAFGDFIQIHDSAAENLRAAPPMYRFSGPAELTPVQYTTISAIVILCPYRLNQLWLDVWRALKAKQGRGEGVTVFDQFRLLQRMGEERPVTYSYEGTTRTILLENPHARFPFPSDIFTGPFDQRWSMKSGWFRLSFIGSELERLRQDDVPFIYL